MSAKPWTKFLIDLNSAYTIKNSACNKNRHCGSPLLTKDDLSHR